ncbi:hypothetical protein BCON_0029g00210 [Botryotinia convoluta]|uniref:Uncharacterized protein n=1 Tax=Botryotinia convoluta TaxID=54673 RepID=A0A4Z1IPJ4_9HELO|nr:hypothetical protein BCON_0029g00210 [Botryotinia convoluta]
MTIRNPNPAQNIYNAPTQPAYEIQSRNRTIPLAQGQGLVQATASIVGMGGTQSGSAHNINVSGGVVASAGGRTGYGGSARVVGQSAVRGSGRGRNLNNGGRSGNGNRGGGGASQHMNASGMHGHAQVQPPHIPVNYVHPHPHVHPSGQGQVQNPHPHTPMNHIQPLVGGIFGPCAPYIPHTGSVLPPLGPYIPRTGGSRLPSGNLGGNRPAYGPLQQLPGHLQGHLPVPLGHPQFGNVNAGGMGFGNGNMIVNGWDSRWDGSGGFRGGARGSSRGGRGQGMRGRRR